MSSRERRTSSVSLAGSLLLAVVVAGLAACAAPPRGGGVGPGAGTGRKQIGVFTVVVGTVTVRDPAAAERRARTGDPVYDGSKVTTGAASRARVEVTGFGAIELGPNTDPYFIDAVSRGGCVIVRILAGLVDVFGSNFCLDVPPAGAEVIVHSDLNVRVAGSVATFTLLRGSATLRRPAPPQRLVPGRPVTVDRGKIVPTISSLGERLAESAAGTRSGNRPGALVIRERGVRMMA